MQTLQNVVVAQGTAFSEFLSELGLLVSNVRCVGRVEPEDGTMQPAIKTSADNQFAFLSALFLPDHCDRFRFQTKSSVFRQRQTSECCTRNQWFCVLLV
ncbi:unnamed protein product [Laminaria digitata]